MHVTARVDYALQAMVALADADRSPVAATALADRFDLSYQYLLSIIGELRRAGLVSVRRGPNGGLRLARPASEITLAEVVWAIDGPLTFADGTQLVPVGGELPGEYLNSLWLTAHRAMLDVFEQVRLADVRAAGTSPAW